MTIVPKRGIMEINEKILSPCGLYCGVCGVYYATRDNNPKFLEKLLNFYQNAMPGLENLTIKKEGDRYFMLDTNQFLCNVGQKFRHKGASHAKNPAIDNK